MRQSLVRRHSDLLVWQFELQRPIALSGQVWDSMGNFPELLILAG